VEGRSNALRFLDNPNRQKFGLKIWTYRNLIFYLKFLALATKAIYVLYPSHFQIITCKYRFRCQKICVSKDWAETKTSFDVVSKLKVFYINCVCVSFIINTFFLYKYNQIFRFKFKSPNSSKISDGNWPQFCMNDSLLSKTIINLISFWRKISLNIQ